MVLPAGNTQNIHPCGHEVPLVGGVEEGGSQKQANE